MTALALASLLSVLPAHAQEAPEIEARALFDQAIADIGRGRYSVAVEKLRRSLELAPRTATAFNLGVALRGTGESVAAVAVFDAILAGDYGALDEPRREQVTALRAEVAREVATLTVRVVEGTSVLVAIDGREITTLERGAETTVTVDPGTRRVTGQATDFEPASLEVAVERGGRQTVELRLRPARDDRPGVLEVRTDSEEARLEIVGVGEGIGTLVRRLAPGEYRVRAIEDGDRIESTVAVVAGRRVRLTLEVPSSSALESPWLWLGIGALVAGGAALAILLLVNREGDPVVDPVWGVVEALR
jgi:hypothetical protein